MISKRQRLSPLWIGIGISFYAFIAIGIAEAGLGVLLPSILSAYDLTPATVTLLFVSQSGGYILAALTSSFISQFWGLARSLLIAASLLTLALVIYAVSPLWLLMVVAGTFLGVSIGLIDAGINTYIVQDSRSAHLIGLLHAFYGVGALSGPALAITALGMGLNWRQVYLILAGVISLLVMAVLGVILYRYPPMMGLGSGKTAMEGKIRSRIFTQSLRSPVVLVTGGLLLVYVGIESCIGNWAYTVQLISRNTPEWIAGYSVSGYWLGLTLGRFKLGYFLKRLGGVRTISLSLVLLLIGLWGWWQFPDQWLTLPLIGLALGAIFPTTIWLIPQRLPDELVPFCVGFATSTASLGAVIIPTGSGWLASVMGLEIIPMLMLPLTILMVGLHGWLVKNSGVNRV